MASTGIRRKVDDLGRVVIPASLRRSLNIREGDAVEVTVEGERVVIAKPRDACVFCGREEDDLRGFRGRLVCRDCLGSLGVLDERVRAVDTADAAPAADAPRRVEPPPVARPPRAVRPVEDDASADTDVRPADAGTRTPWERTRRPAAFAGPIDGDALARQRAEEPPARRRPPQDPASTTAW